LLCTKLRKSAGKKLNIKMDDLTKIKGKHEWIPGWVRRELHDIKMEKKIENNNEAWFEFTKSCQVGREVTRMMKLDFTWKPLPLIDPKKTKNQKQGGVL